MKTLTAIACVATFAAIATCVAPASQSQDDAPAAVATQAVSGYDTIVGSDGAIAFPEGYKTWSHMGSWAVVNEGGEGNGIHNVFTTPDVIAAFNETGEFPDGAVLVKEVYASAGGQLTTGSANWATTPQVWFVMIKDTEGRFPDNPLWGNGWGWALFNASNPEEQVATDFQTDCVGCHVPAQATDWIYTYAYPVLDIEERASFEAPQAGGGDTMTSAAAQTVSGDPEAGRAGFALCRTCHTLDEGRNGIGPSLHDVIGRTAGSIEGFGYTDAMTSSGVVWTPEALDKYLLDPGAFIPGNRMAQLFAGGVKDDKRRQDIIAYLVESSGK